MASFLKELWKEKISLLGLVVSIATFIYSSYNPVSIPLVSQTTLSSIGAGSGFAVSPVVVSLELISIILGVIAILIGSVRIHRRRR